VAAGGREGDRARFNRQIPEDRQTDRYKILS